MILALLSVMFGLYIYYYCMMFLPVIVRMLVVLLCFILNARMVGGRTDASAMH